MFSFECGGLAPRGGGGGDGGGPDHNEEDDALDVDVEEEEEESADAEAAPPVVEVDFEASAEFVASVCTSRCAATTNDVEAGERWVSRDIARHMRGKARSSIEHVDGRDKRSVDTCFGLLTSGSIASLNTVTDYNTFNNTLQSDVAT